MASVATAITFDAGGAGSTSITFYWDGTHGSTPFMIGRDDGTRVGPITNGSPFTVSGLTAATTYFFYPYYEEASQSIRFSGARPPQGIIGTVPVGSPPVAYTAQTFWPAQDQMLRGRIQLAMLMATTGVKTGTGSGSGGSGGGGGGGGGGGKGGLQP